MNYILNRGFFDRSNNDYFRYTNHPKRGAHVITNETIHTTSIICDASLFDLLFFEYRKGLVMAKYLSIDIAQRLNIDAVQRHTSNETQMSHIKRPNVHVPKSSNSDKLMSK